MSSNFFFFYQRTGGEEHWTLELAEKREDVIRNIRPAFVSVLDLSSVPKDNDWSKIKYRGPLYFDFDADGDIPLVCEQFKVFLGKLAVELNFDLEQASFFASGSKGFHIEIPQECFIPKPPVSGTVWLPYVYREMAQDIIVDTMDLRVYTGKRGRMWRTPDVQRENGNYKVSITPSEAMSMTPELYAEVIASPRPRRQPSPAFCNSTLAMLYQSSQEKMLNTMRGKKKRQQAANAVLDPWKKAKKHPPTIEGLMNGTLVAEGVGFQHISMQLAIYAASVDMELEEFLKLCDGLCSNHVSDSRRYNTFEKRKEELARMWRYMNENSLYDFETGPLVKMVKPGVSTPDLGVMETEDTEDTPRRQPSPDDDSDADGETSTATPRGDDIHKGVRRGFFMNRDGMWVRRGDLVESVCRAALRNVESFQDLLKGEFKGYEFDVCLPGRSDKRAMLASDAFTSAAAMKKFFAAHQISYQGGEPETTALLDVMSDKAGKGGRTYVYPREGFFVERNPETKDGQRVKIYLTQDTFLSSIDISNPDYFRLQYRPEQAVSSYNVDLHRAPKLDESMAESIHDLFSFTRPDIAANLIGWFVAAHYRSLYHALFNQFPLLQVYGEAGAGKTQTISMLAHLHWYMTPVSVKSAMSCTNFAMDSHASTSTSAPFILDEYKPREISKVKGRLEKIKDVFKASYVSGDIGERGTLNRGAENHLAVVKSQCTAPIVFLGEAVEAETAIVERCVTVMLSKTYVTRHRQAAFLRLQQDSSALSALGRAIIEAGFSIDMEAMRDEVNGIREGIERNLPDFDDEDKKRVAPRLIYNRAVIVHALTVLKRVLQKTFEDQFDAVIDSMIGKPTEMSGTDADRAMQINSMSEISKVVSRIALLSRAIDTPYQMKAGTGKDYYVGHGWVEVKVESAYDNYRRYCASISDTPLFDNLETFWFALQAYSPCVDSICASSELRVDSSTERIVRLDTRKLTREGVQSFKI